jgi:hypothetical protein
MDVVVNNRISSGASADVFAIGNGQVLKAFRRKPHISGRVSDWRDHDAMTRAEFRAEVRSYERLQRFPELERFIPKYFGEADPIALLQHVADAASLYIAECGLVLEYIPGVASKLVYLERTIRAEVESVLERFHNEVQIGHVWDSSCFVPGTRAKFTIIDFGGWDGFAEYQLSLNATGSFTPGLRARLEKENAACYAPPMLPHVKKI